MKSLAVLLLLFLCRPASACECRIFRPKDELKQAAYVFRGAITKITDSEITFAVTRVWKGKLPAEFTMPLIVHEDPCLPGFARPLIQTGTELLIYAWRLEALRGELAPVGCSRTTTIDRATEDLRQLGPGHRPNPYFTSPIGTITVP